MAVVVFLRGVNVGGHRRFRPSQLAAQLAHLDTVNLGAAGTLVVRAPISRSRLRAEIVRHLPFETEIAICSGRDILRLVAGDFFAGQPARRDQVRFVGVLTRAPRRVPRDAPRVPFDLPAAGRWLVRVLAREGRLVVGVHRREMRALGELGKLDRSVGAPVTIRGWSTLLAVARLLRPDSDPE